MGVLLLPLMTIPSQPARLSLVASLPPTEESAISPVRGDFEIIWARPDVGEIVPVRGPVKMLIAISS